MLDKEKLSLAVRLKRGEKTLDEAAREVGVSQPTLSRIENGVHAPDLDTFFRLCAWMGVPADLFRREKLEQAA